MIRGVFGIGRPLGIFILLPVRKPSICLVSSLGVLSTSWLPRASSSFFKSQTCPFVLHHSWCWVSSGGIFILLHVQKSHGVVSSGCPQHQDGPRSSSLFMHKKCPSVLHHLWVSSALGAFPGHLHPSHASRPPSSCVISWHPWHVVPSQSICMLLHMPATSIHLASASHPRVLSTRCPPWASLSFPCKTARSVCYHLLVSLAPGHRRSLQATSLHPTPFGVFGAGCPPGTSLCSLMHKPTSATLSHCFWMFFALLEHLRPP